MSYLHSLRVNRQRLFFTVKYTIKTTSNTTLTVPPKKIDSPEMKMIRDLSSRVCRPKDVSQSQHFENSPNSAKRSRNCVGKPYPLMDRHTTNPLVVAIDLTELTLLNIHRQQIRYFICTTTFDDYNNMDSNEDMNRKHTHTRAKRTASARRLAGQRSVCMRTSFNFNNLRLLTFWLCACVRRTRPEEYIVRSY